MSEAYEAQLRTDPAERRRRGAFMTPPELAREVVRLALDAWCDAARRGTVPVMLDPSCGTGNLLVAGAERLLARGAKPLQVARALRGVEIDATAARIRAEGMDKMADVYSRGPTRLVFEEKDPRGFKEFQTQLAEHSTEGSALTMQGVQRERPSLFDLEAGFKQMKVPTLVIAGDEDDPTLEPSMFLKRTIMSSALLVMPKCGHTMNLEDPDAFNRAVLDFVTQVDCGRWTQRIPESLSGAIIAAKEK